MKSVPTILAIILISVSLGACGGGGGGSSSAPPLANASPGGIWKGTDPLTNQALVGLVTEAGEFHFIEANGTQYVGTVTVTGTSFSGNFEGYAPNGATFADGSSHGTGTMTGTVQARSSFTAATQFKTDLGATTTDSLSLTFDALYNTASSLAAVAGNYLDNQTGTAVSINSNGVIFGQSATTGCVLNGAVTLINASYDAYQFAVDVANCQGAYAVLNGASLTGIGAIDPTQSPPSLIVGYTGTANGQKVSAVEILTQD